MRSSDSSLESDLAVSISRRVIDEKSRDLMTAAVTMASLAHWLLGLKAVMGEEAWQDVVSAEAQRLVGASSFVASLPVVSAASRAVERKEVPKPEKPSRIRWVKDQIPTEKGMAGLDLIKLARDNPEESDWKGSELEFAEWLSSSAQRGRLRRRGDQYYNVDRALLGETISGPPRALDIVREIILSTIQSEGGRAEPGVIVRGVREHPKASEALSPKSQYPYTILMRMVGDGTLLKEGSFYVLPEMRAALSEERSADRNLFDTDKERLSRTAS